MFCQLRQQVKDSSESSCMSDLLSHWWELEIWLENLTLFRISAVKLLTGKHQVCL